MELACSHNTSPAVQQSQTIQFISALIGLLARQSISASLSVRLSALLGGRLRNSPLLDITTHSLPISFLYRRRIHIQYFNLMYSNPHELKTGREGSSDKNNSLIRFMNIDSQKCSKTLFVHPKGSLILFLL